jgi:hypothetical protein
MGCRAGADRGQAAVNAFDQPLATSRGTATARTAPCRPGGGIVGFGSTFDRDNFFRDAGRSATTSRSIAWACATTSTPATMQSVDSEDLTRSSNGWGSITCRAAHQLPGHADLLPRRVPAAGLGAVPTIHSEFRSQDIECNDTISWKNWTFNVGFSPARTRSTARA